MFDFPNQIVSKLSHSGYSSLIKTKCFTSTTNDTKKKISAICIRSALFSVLKMKFTLNRHISRAVCLKHYIHFRIIYSHLLFINGNRKKINRLYLWYKRASRCPLSLWCSAYSIWKLFWKCLDLAHCHWKERRAVMLEHKMGNKLGIGCSLPQCGLI